MGHEMNEALTLLSAGIGIGAVSLACWILALCLRYFAGKSLHMQMAAVMLAAIGVAFAVIDPINVAAVKAAQVKASTPPPPPAKAEVKPGAKPAATEKPKAAPVVKTAESKPTKEPKEPQIPLDLAASAARLNMLNLCLATFTLLLTLSTLAIQYIFGFNAHIVKGYPLPVSWRWIEAFSPNQHILQLPPDHTSRPELLRQLARRGENFIYFGNTDPIQESTSLPRLFGRLELVRGDDESASLDEQTDHVKLILEFAWMGRCAVILTEEDSAGEWLEKVKQYLKSAESSPSNRIAGRTLNLIWDFEEAPPFEIGTELCQHTNCRWITLDSEEGAEVSADAEAQVA